MGCVESVAHEVADLHALDYLRQIQSVVLDGHQITLREIDCQLVGYFRFAVKPLSAFFVKRISHNVAYFHTVYDVVYRKVSVQKLGHTQIGDFDGQSVGHDGAAACFPRTRAFVVDKPENVSRFQSVCQRVQTETAVCQLRRFYICDCKLNLVGYFLLFVEPFLGLFVEIISHHFADLYVFEHGVDRKAAVCYV